MQSSPHAVLHSFAIDIQFSSDGEPFAVERYTVQAPDWYRAQRDALERSVESPYDNCRIPNLTRCVLMP